MAENIEIQIAGQYVKVPAWATEETAKEMTKYNEASARALTELVKGSKASGRVVAENQKIFRDLKNATKQDRTEQIKAEKNLNEMKSKHGKALDNASKSLQKTGKDIVGAFNKGSLSGVAAALASVVGLGAAAGFAVGAVESFAKNVSQLSNVGVGLGTSLTDLRNQATLTGVNIESYGKMVLANGDALRALGENAQDGARVFSNLSRQTREVAREFNNFGMTNSEFNDVLLQEIELRRRSGMMQARIVDSVSESMNNLMRETTALSAMTGQDRRELLRARSEALNTEAATAFRMAMEREGKALSENFGMIASVFSSGGEVGEQIGQAMSNAIASGIDFRVANQGAVAGIATISAEANKQLQEIFEFARDSYESMDPSEFTAQLNSRLAELGDALPTTEIKRLGLLSQRGNDEAGAVIRLMSELQGLESDVNKNREAQQQATEGLRTSNVLALASTIEELSARISDSALSTVIGNFTDDLDAAGEQLVESLQNLSDNFGPDNTLFGGLKNSYTDLTDASDRLKHGAAAAALALGGLAVVAGTSRRLFSRRGGAPSQTPSSGGGRGRAAGGAAAGAAASSGRGGALRSLFKGLGRLVRTGGPVGAAIGAAVTPSTIGDGTVSGSFDQNNPFPENGSQSEIADWHTRRNNYTSQVEPAPGNTPLFPSFNDLSANTQRDMRLDTPNTRGYLDNMRANGMIDKETHAIITNRTFERLEEHMRRQADETTRMRRILEENQ